VRILVVGINFFPELTGIGKYTADMVAYLTDEGNQVHVITAPPYYPYWKVQPGYNGWQYKHEEWEGAQVYRAPLWVPRNPTGIKRLFHLFSFAISSFPLLLLYIVWHPDVVICVAPAFFSAPFAWFTARLCGAKSWLHIQDFELDAATSLGMLPPDHFLTKLAARIENWLYARFDRVSTISKRMMDRLCQKGVRPERIQLFPNWVDTNLIVPLSDPRDSLRRTLGIPDEKVVVLYSGNMGYKQGLECVMEAASDLQMFTNLLFVFCGDGAAKEKLEKSAFDLSNVKFLCLQPVEKLNQLLNMADIHILPQRPDAADLVMPSKLLGMLASGKPIITTANPETEVGSVLSHMGVLVPPNDLRAISQAILGLATSPSLRMRLGDKGRAFVCEHWSKNLVLFRFQMDLLDLLNDSLINSRVELMPHEGV
jgi:colanic acid biosynthesis glycosyl transferase WcaI